MRIEVLRGDEGYSLKVEGKLVAGPRSSAKHVIVWDMDKDECMDFVDHLISVTGYRGSRKDGKK